MFRKIALCLFLAALAGSLNAQVRITEWMYNNSEFIEFTNLGLTSQDLTGWSFQDASDLVTPFSLTPLGTLAAGESALVTQSDAASFRTLWGLGPDVKILSYGAGILQREDTIKLFDSSSTLVDTLAYGDDLIGGIRTDTASGWTTFSNLGLNNVSAWQLSVPGDAQNSYSVVVGSKTVTANPGTYAVPEPEVTALICVGSIAIFLFRRRRVA